MRPRNRLDGQKFERCSWIHYSDDKVHVISYERVDCGNTLGGLGVGSIDREERAEGRTGAAAVGFDGAEWTMDSNPSAEVTVAREGVARFMQRRRLASACWN